MTQLKFNLDMDELTEQILNSNLNAATKGLAVAIFNAYMEAERDAHVQAKQRERSEDRQDMRNGYYEPDYTLPVGRLRLRVPRTRSGEFSTGHSRSTTHKGIQSPGFPGNSICTGRRSSDTLG